MATKSGRSITKLAKLAAVALVLTFYFIFSYFHGPSTHKSGRAALDAARVQLDKWPNATGKADMEKRAMVLDAMQHTWNGYKAKAWGADEVRPVTGGKRTTRNNWGALMVDGSTTLAVMGLWPELKESVEYIIENIDWDSPKGSVDPFETTIRYVGSLVSLVDMLDHGIIPASVISSKKRAGLLAGAVKLSDRLLDAYKTPTGLPWPRLNFETRLGGAQPWARDSENPAVGPARAGSSILENCVLSELTKQSIYCRNSEKAWAPLVWSKYIPTLPGLIDSPIDVKTGLPTKREMNWDGGHDSYYEYLLKFPLLMPSSPHAKEYKTKFLEAATALRWNLTSRSAPTDDYPVSHLFMGKWTGSWFQNEMSHLACFAPGTLLLASRALSKTDPAAASLEQLGLAILDGCRRVYSSTPTGLAPEKWSWNVAISHAPQRQGFPSRWLPPSKAGRTAHSKHTPQDDEPIEHRQQPTKITYTPQTPSHLKQAKQLGYWITDTKNNLRPEYVESLFYAFRITGNPKYREWAWDVFMAFEKHAKTKWGYSAVHNVLVDPELQAVPLADEQESFWAAETLKYLYLIFCDVGFMKLDEWVFTTEAHPLKRRT